MHASIALKDENGQNMPADNDVYFTTHYNEEGKLTEVRISQTIKFSSKEDNAVDYIEREGKIYLTSNSRQYKEY